MTKQGKFAVIIGIIFLMGCSVYTGAQDSPVFSDEIILYRGERFMPFIDGPIEESYIPASGLTRKQMRIEPVMKENLSLVSSFLKGCPVLDPPQGVKLVISSKTLPHADFNEYELLRGSLQLEFYVTMVCNEKPCYDKKTDATVTISINDPEKLVATHIIDDIWLQPKMVSDFWGYPVYRFASTQKEITVVSGSVLPLYIPVVREDFIMALIRHFNEIIEENQRIAALPQSKERFLSLSGEEALNRRAEFEEAYEKMHRFDPLLARKLKENYEITEKRILEAGADSLAAISQSQYLSMQIGVWREGVRKLRAELNAMSPTERRSQAHWSESEALNTSGLTPPGHPGSNPLARINPAIFDSSRPVTDIQLITVEWGIDPAPFANFKRGRNLQYHKLFMLTQCEEAWRNIFKLTKPAGLSD